MLWQKHEVMTPERSPALFGSEMTRTPTGAPFGLRAGHSRTGMARPCRTDGQNGKGATIVRRLTLTLANSLDEIPRLADRLEEFCEAHGIPTQARLHVTLVLDELVTNAISYGFDADVRHPEAVVITLEIDGAGLTIVMDDSGKPFDPLSVAPTDTGLSLEDREIGGLGLHFVREFMTSVAYERIGDRNRLTLRKQIDQDSNAR